LLLTNYLCSSEKKSNKIPAGFVEYQQKPREYIFNSISTTINVDTSVTDVFSSPYDQTREQLVDGVKKPKGKSGKTNILLIRTGEAKRGVIGLHQSGLQNEQSRGLSVRFKGVDDEGIASYLLSLYCSAAILADDAIAVLEDVEVGDYYDYT